MKTNAIKIFSSLLFVIISAQTIFSQSEKIVELDPIAYFHQRSQAIGLVKEERWQDSIMILENLVEEYQNDADLFYLLGLSYYQVGQYQNAVTVLKKTLKLGGTILTNIPTGSAPSNDIMIKIAESYAKNGDKENALLWLQKGLAARYDEKPFLKGNPAFESFHEDREFLEVFGRGSQEDLSREEAWSKDLDYMEQRINELHYSPYHAISKSDLSKAFQDIKTEIVSLSDQEIIVELMKIIGRLGNGHNLIIPTSTEKGALKKLPVQFYLFNDGLFIVEAEEGFKKWIGYKVDSIENTPAKDALQKTNTVNARDNAMQTLWLGPYYLGLPDVLKGLGIIDNVNEITITLSKGGIKSQKVKMEPINWNFSDFPRISRPKGVITPLYLSKTDDPYWYEPIPESNALYVQFNVVTEKETQSLREFNIELRDHIEQNAVQYLILDLRLNHGGNGSILPPMLKTLINFEVQNPEGKIFVLMGRETFSAAQNLLTDISRYTNPILVGEPSGSKPNHIGEAGWFKLPYSGLMGLISTQFHQSSKAEDHRQWIAPHVPIGLSSKDYFSGADRAMKAIMELIIDFENKR